jgi:hypothetical protein
MEGNGSHLIYGRYSSGIFSGMRVGTSWSKIARSVMGRKVKRIIRKFCIHGLYHIVPDCPPV